MNDHRPSILLVGNFLSAHSGTRSAGEELDLCLKQNGWDTITTSKRVFRILRLADMVLHVLLRRKEYRIACVEVYSGAAFVWAEIITGLLSLLGRPCVLVLHGGGLPDFALGRMQRVRRLFGRARRIVTPSRFVLDAFRDPDFDMQYIPNGIDLERFAFRKRELPYPRLVWIRAFHTIYQPQLAVRAFAGIRRVFPNAHLTMIGPDKKDGSLELTLQDASLLNVLDGLTIMGAVPRSEIPMWLDQADVFLNTTRYESFGQAVLEAAAAGLLIVSTDVGELSRLWENEMDAMLVPSGDTDAIADAVIRVLSQPELAAHLSGNAHRKALQFDWQVVLPQWERLFMEIDGKL